MAEDLDNPLNPILALILTDDTPDRFVYTLRVQVTDRCIDPAAPSFLLPDERSQPDLEDLIVTLQLLDRTATCTTPVRDVELTGNPKGLPGVIAVVIKDIPTSRQHSLQDGDGHGPQSDGKTIIRFQDATHR